MTIALDLGVHRLKSLRRDNVQLIGRSSRAVHAVLPDSPARRKMLDQVSIPFAQCEDNLVLMGDAAADFSQLFQVPALPLLREGKMPHDDPPARQILGSLVESLLPKARHLGEICCLTLPGAAGDHETEFLTRLVRLQGYTPQILSAGMGVVFAEMVRHSFSGIGVSFGTASCEASLAHRGVELARCTIRRGGHWIDEQLADADGRYLWDASGHQYLDTDDLCRWKEGYVESILEPTSQRGRLLTELYRDLVGEVLTTALQEFEPILTARDIPQPLALVACGGSARIPGFAQLVQQIAREIEAPLRPSAIRVVTDSDYTIARGCLINAELETDSHTPAALRVAG